MRVVVGVRGRDEQQIERQPDPVAPDLHVALLQDVEQADLDPLGEVGELVDRHDPAVGPGDQPVVDRQLVGQVATLGDPDRVDVADQVGHARVGGGELLRVPILPADPVDGDPVALLRHERAASSADRTVRVIVHLAPGDRRDAFVQQVDDAADQPGLGLPALAEQDQVVPGEDPAFERRQHGVVEPHDPLEQRFRPSELGEQAGPELLLHAPVRVPRGPELTEGGGHRHGNHDTQPGEIRAYAIVRGAKPLPYRRAATWRATSAASTSRRDARRMTDETATTCGSWLGTRSCANR